jgi:hypothetical protein
MTFVLLSYACHTPSDKYIKGKTQGNMRLSGFCPFCPNPYKKQKRLIYYQFFYKTIWKYG